MSTKALGKVLRAARNGDVVLILDARAAINEVDALRNALNLVIREKALQDWESSMPTELADAIRLLQRISKEAE